MPTSPQQQCPLPGGIDDNGDLLRAIAEEYRTLFLLEQFNDQDAKRIEEILTLARQDKQLDALITDIIFQESTHQGLLSGDCLELYKDQVAALREYQGTDFSGLQNTMFGNTMTSTHTSTTSTKTFTNENIHKLAIALQDNASCDVDQPSCSR